MSSTQEKAGQGGGLRNRIVSYGRKPADQFTANPLNWRVHPQNQREAVAASLRQLGWIDVAIENATTGNLIDGHERVWQALKNGGDVPYISVELTPEEEALALATLDPLTNMAGTDAAKLDELLQQVQTDEAAIQAMLAGLAEEAGLYLPKGEPSDAEPQIDRAEELRQQWGVELGQLWRLPSRTAEHEHRLICGDCTEAAVVERVMAGEKARLVATSPPYNNQRDYEIGDFDWLALAQGFIFRCFDILDSPGDVLVNLGLEHRDGAVNDYWSPWLAYCASAGHPLYGWYVWDKGAGFPGEWNGRLGPAHEWLFHFSVGRQSAQKWVRTSEESAMRGPAVNMFRQKDGTLHKATSPDKIGQPYKIPDSVIRITREMRRGLHTQVHPATFPVEFPEFLVRTWSAAGHNVYDPFLGSGTTLIACENLSRQCRAVELSPGYVAVALERYFQAFGIEAELVG